MKLFEPSPSINYNLITLIYFLCSVLAVVLYALEETIFRSYLQPDSTASESMKELAESTQGLYLIFVPFIPCLVWSFKVLNKVKKGAVMEVKSKDD
jgi:uncharacterized membrane protein